LFREEIEQINRGGFAVDNEEFEEGLFCVSVPIRQTTGDVLAAISVSAPSSRLNKKNCAAMKEKLNDCAEKISYAMFKYDRI
jgi:DNA-binding IclR family transcriptional regulator